MCLCDRNTILSIHNWDKQHLICFSHLCLQPSFLTYWVHSFYTVAYVLWKIWRCVVLWCREWLGVCSSLCVCEYCSCFFSIVVGGFSSNKVSDNHFSTKYVCQTHTHTHTHTQSHTFTHTHTRYLILVSGVLALLMYVSAYFWYVSLKGTR